MACVTVLAGAQPPRQEVQERLRQAAQVLVGPPDAVTGAAVTLTFCSLVEAIESGIDCLLYCACASAAFVASSADSRSFSAFL